MKRSKFYCENCHKEVRPTAKVCPYCGRFFTAVRCPSCAYVGEARDFVRGCPSCGYAASIPGKDEGFDTIDLGDVTPSRLARKRPGAPGWVFPLGAGIILAVFVILVVVYLRF